MAENPTPTERIARIERESRHNPLDPDDEQWLIDQAKRQQWISVEDRLPEERKSVLCWLGDDFEIGYVDTIHEATFWVGTFSADPTHWQPLPDPPEVKDE